MASALSAPLAAAGLVLCLAGVAKLRSPAGASDALATIRVPGGVPLVRALAALEVVLGVSCAVDPSPASGAAAAAAYAIFAVVALLLAHRHSSCGCFGEREVPTTPAHAGLSGLLALVAVAAAFSSPHGIAWMLASPPENAVVLVIGTVGAAYGVVLAYTEFPQAWSSWNKVEA
jgi:hypothetical protein